LIGLIGIISSLGISLFMSQLWHIFNVSCLAYFLLKS
jgi:hypothetical protein